MQVLAYLELKPLRLAVRHFLEEKNKTNKNQTIFRFPNAICFGFWFENPVTLTRPTIWEYYIHRHVYIHAKRKILFTNVVCTFFLQTPVSPSSTFGRKKREKKGRRLLLDSFFVNLPFVPVKVNPARETFYAVQVHLYIHYYSLFPSTPLNQKLTAIYNKPTYSISQCQVVTTASFYSRHNKISIWLLWHSFKDLIHTLYGSTEYMCTSIS